MKILLSAYGDEIIIRPECNISKQIIGGRVWNERISLLWIGNSIAALFSRMHFTWLGTRAIRQ